MDFIMYQNLTPKRLEELAEQKMRELDRNAIHPEIVSKTWNNHIKGILEFKSYLEAREKANRISNAKKPRNDSEGSSNKGRED